MTVFCLQQLLYVRHCAEFGEVPAMKALLLSTDGHLLGHKPRKMSHIFPNHTTQSLEKLHCAGAGATAAVAASAIEKEEDGKEASAPALVQFWQKEEH